MDMWLTHSSARLSLPCLQLDDMWVTPCPQQINICVKFKGCDATCNALAAMQRYIETLMRLRWNVVQLRSTTGEKKDKELRDIICFANKHDSDILYIAGNVQSTVPLAWASVTLRLPPIKCFWYTDVTNQTEMVMENPNSRKDCPNFDCIHLTWSNDSNSENALMCYTGQNEARYLFKSWKGVARANKLSQENIMGSGYELIMHILNTKCEPQPSLKEQVCINTIARWKKTAFNVK